jgi:hypothetical protein
LEVDWKSILKRWETLRLPYNLVVGVSGLPALAMIPSLPLSDAVGGAIIFGLGANVMYFPGPMIELYANWFVDTWEGRIVPRWFTRFVRTHYPTLLLFVTGTLFSVSVTLATGLSAAFSVAVPNQ